MSNAPYSSDALDELRRILLAPDALADALAPLVDDLLQERIAQLAGAMLEALTPALHQAVREALHDELREPSPELASGLAATLEPAIAQVVREQIGSRARRQEARRRTEEPRAQGSAPPQAESPLPPAEPETIPQQQEDVPRLKEQADESRDRPKARRGRFRIIGLVLLLTVSLLGSRRWSVAEALPTTDWVTNTPHGGLYSANHAARSQALALLEPSPSPEPRYTPVRSATERRSPTQAATPSFSIAPTEAATQSVALFTVTPTPPGDTVVRSATPQASTTAPPQIERVRLQEQTPNPTPTAPDPEPGKTAAAAPASGENQGADERATEEAPVAPAPSPSPILVSAVQGELNTPKTLPAPERAMPDISDHDATTWLLENSGARVAEEVTLLPAARNEPAPVLYLTFDDGPNATWTPRILDVLAQYNALATFFILGREAAERPELVQAAADAGHLVGHHTWSHPLLTGLDQAAFEQEIQQTTTALGDLGTLVSPFLRPPYGAVSPDVRTYAEELGLTIVRWNIDSLDWNMRTAEEIAWTVISQAAPGKVVLMHDGGGDRSQTVAALEVILDTLSQQGYVFETVLKR
jgi:peptidoglycan/xylan/chitin deacetylase (PgdA/CDA1 family)